MTISVIVVHQVLLAMFGAVEGKLSAIIYLIICGVVGMVVYGYLSLRLGLAQKLLGERITKYSLKLGFK